MLKPERYCYDATAALYDATAALILALDSLSVAQESDGDVLHAAVGALDFQGASGRMKFEASLDRDVTTVDISLFNLIYHNTGNPTTDVEFREVRTFTDVRLEVVEVAPIIWCGNTTVQPVDLTTAIPRHNRNLLDSFLVALAIGLSAISVTMALSFMYWAHRYRHEEAVKSSQPTFLILIALGCIITLTATIPLTRDHSNSEPDPNVTPGTRGVYSTLDGACAGAFWFYFAGFDLTYGSLFAKLW